MDSYANTTTETVFREVNISYKRKRKHPSVTSAGSASRFIRSVLPNNSQEHLLALYLDGAHQPIGFSVVCTGIANQCPVHPREVFQRAIVLGSHSLILAHNHPSGGLQPSAEDIKITAQIKEAGQVLGIKLLDHIIVTDDGYYSFQEAGQI